FLNRQAKLEKIKLVSEYASDCFVELIESLHRKEGNKVVVLIDEYDKPILDAIGKPEAADIRAFLQEFYVVLKSADDHLKFVFMTGVTKVAKVSIFSALNNLEDITLDDEYASICGYTQEELERDFSEYIDETASLLAMTREDLLAKIRKWYDGYSWDGKTSVYNPFSTLPFFKKKTFSNYWFVTGTPTFVINRLKKHGLAKAEAKNLANEAFYHIIFQLWMTMLGFNIQSERMTNRGRIDAVLQQDGVAIVTELKYHATTETDTLLNQAIAQIREKR
uniref:AAA family ATPase n=1 Tax=Candidatus Symbiothrix dinenymphae TaxID=467085 RepID=UPI000A685B45